MWTPIFADILLLEQDKTGHTAATVATGSLGFSSELPQVSPRKLIFLGFTIDSVMKELSLPQEEMERIVKEAKAILDVQRISARSLAQLFVKMSAALLAIHLAPLHYRSLQNLKHLVLTKKGYVGKIGLSL